MDSHVCCEVSQFSDLGEMDWTAMSVVRLVLWSKGERINTAKWIVRSVIFL